MEQFVARQPIFDRKQKVYAYELLFRSGLANYFDHLDGDQATSRVIANTFLLFGIEELTGQAKAFINFTESLLIKDYALILPKDRMVVEILENVEPTAEVVASCQRLKDHGYELALDDFVYDPKFKPLLDLADIVKVDFLLSSRKEQEHLSREFRPKGIKLLAEKVETHEVFQQALDMGYVYFQGYFFSKPFIISRKDIPTSKLQYLRILKVVNQPELEFKDLAKLIQAEISVSYKLLKYINSAAFGLRRQVTSILQALTILGEKEVRKWVSLLALTGLGIDKPAEVIFTSLIRGKTCELVAEQVGLAQRGSDLFLMGLFSLLDAIVDRPLSELLAELPVAGDVKDALLGKKGRFRTIFELILAFEKGEWVSLPQLTEGLGLDDLTLPQIYFEAIKWSQQILFG